MSAQCFVGVVAVSACLYDQWYGRAVPEHCAGSLALVAPRCSRGRQDISRAAAWEPSHLASKWRAVLDVNGDGMYPESDPPKVAVLARGERWAVVYNPAGVLAHPIAWKSKETQNTMVTRLQRTFRKPCFLVHRLDRGASGMSLVAFDAEACTAMHQALTSPTSSKVYYALCRGSGHQLVGTGPLLIDRPLRDHREGLRHQMKLASTEIEVLYGGEPPRCCLVRASPHTGRYHQIRRHLQNISLPIIGDEFDRKNVRREWEANAMPLPRRVMLHLHRLFLPATHATPQLNVSCPFPPGMAELIWLACPQWAGLAADAEPALFSPPLPDLMSAAPEI